MPSNRRHSSPKLQRKESIVCRFQRDLNSDRWIQILTLAPWNPPAPLWLRNSCNLLLYDNAYMFASSNSWKSLPAILSNPSHGSVGGVVASIAALQAVDLGSIPGRRKEVFWDLDSIQANLVTPPIHVPSPTFVAQPYCQWLLPTFSSSLSILAGASQRHFRYPWAYRLCSGWNEYFKTNRILFKGHLQSNMDVFRWFGRPRQP